MKNLITLSLFLGLVATTFAQAPNTMSYQAVVRDAEQAVVANQAVTMKISILQGNVDGLVAYAETHGLTTNSNGLVTTEIGNGMPSSGDFSDIDWSNGPYFIKTETDPNGGTNYTISGTSQLLSVPYALHAKSAETLTTNGGPLSVETDVQTSGDFTYAEPQTRYYAVSGAAFTKYDTADPYDINRSFTDYPTHTSLQGGTDGQVGQIVASVNLPNGAIVTNVEGRFRESDGTPVVAQLNFVEISGASGAVLASCVAEDEAGVQNVDVATNIEIRNDIRTYALVFKSNQNSSNSALYFARLTYTVQQAD